MNGDGRIVKCLIVSIAEYEGHIVDTFTIHVVNGIAATASYTNHLDVAVLFCRLAEVEQYVVVHTIYNFTIYDLFFFLNNLLSRIR